MPDAHVTHQPAHMASMENIPHQSIVFTQKESVVLEGNNTRRILATVLKNSQCIIKKLIDVGSTDDTDNAAHGWIYLRVLKLNVNGMQTRVPRLQVLRTPPGLSERPAPDRGSGQTRRRACAWTNPQLPQGVQSCPKFSITYPRAAARRAGRAWRDSQPQ